MHGGHGHSHGSGGRSAPPTETAKIIETFAAPFFNEPETVVEAVKGGDLDDVKEFFECASPAATDAKCAEGHPLLLWAALFGHDEVLEYLVANRGADVNIRNARGEVALHWAALNGKQKMVLQLHRLGANMLAADEKGYTLLHFAAQRKRLPVLENLAVALGEQGMTIDCADRSGRTPLHWACYLDHADIVEWLLTKGASLETTDSTEMLPLHWAAVKGSIGAVDALLENGAADQLALKDKNGSTPLDLAVQSLGRAEGIATKHRLRSVANKLSTQQKRNRWLKYAWIVGLEPSKQPKTIKVMGTIFMLWGMFVLPVGVLLHWQYMFELTSYHSLLTMLFWASAGLQYLCWYLTVFSDPGTIVFPDGRLNPDYPGSDLLRVEFEQARLLGELDGKKYCLTCQILKPLRSKHCRITKRCVARFDHFCPWMNNVVARKNYATFILFLSFGQSTAVLYNVLNCSAISALAKGSGQSFAATFFEWPRVGLNLCVARALLARSALARTLLELFKLSCTRTHLLPKLYLAPLSNALSPGGCSTTCSRTGFTAS